MFTLLRQCFLTFSSVAFIFVPRLQADESPAELLAEVDLLRNADDDDVVVRRLIQIDTKLNVANQGPSVADSTVILVDLAHRRTSAALEFLRSVFETQTPRRHDAAYALSVAAMERPTSDQDWRYLVRSLTIVENEQAVSVLKALKRFRRRATKGVWVREVILVGLRLPEKQRIAAVDLLEHWTQHKAPDSATAGESMTHFQNWFADNYPDAPPATWPIDPPEAKWTFDTLMKLQDRSAASDPDAGSAVFVKAKCNSCHRRTGVAKQPPDDRLGPDLTTLGWRRQRKEILLAILYPSHHLDDEYPVTTVVLNSGKTATGLLTPVQNGQLRIIAADNQETVFRRDEIEETKVAAVSNMPTRLLDKLTEHEIHSLMSFLTERTGDYAPHRRQ